MQEYDGVPMVFTAHSPASGTCMWEIPERLKRDLEKLPEEVRDKLMKAHMKLLEGFLSLICGLLYTPEAQRKRRAAELADLIFKFLEKSGGKTGGDGA